MHEANFTQEIVSVILQELKRYPAYRAKEVKVKVGEMLHLVTESVLAHYQLMTKGTHLEGIALILEEEPVEVKCHDCGFIGGVEDHHFLSCSKCDSFQVQLLKGKEVTIDAIEMDVESEKEVEK